MRVDDRAHDERVVALAPLLRRVVGARLADPHAVDDVVQETLTRLLESGQHLADDALVPYAIVTARNLVFSAGRRDAVGRRHAHRLVDAVGPAPPEEQVLVRQEWRSVAAGLTRLSPEEAATLVAHEVDGASTSAMAADAGTTPGAVAVRLAYARAKLRVEYVLALRNVEPPTSRCRPVLVSLSAGDRRRQRALDAGGHLLDCATCAQLSEPLLARARGLAALWPLALPPLALWRLARQHPLSSTATAGAVAVAAVAGSAMVRDRADVPTALPPPASVTSATSVAGPGGPGAPPSTAVSVSPAPTASVVVAGRPLTVATRETLAAAVGAPVRGSGVAVASVPSDEGFWVAFPPGQHLWVQLGGSGESPVDVDVGQTVDFEGVVAPNPETFDDQVGVQDEEGAALLAAQGHHVAVERQALAVHPRSGG